MIDNYVEVKVNFETFLDTNDFSIDSTLNEGGFPGLPAKSLKSIITYQLGFVYRDRYGRETPVLTSKSGSIKLPKSNFGLHVANIGKPISILDYKSQPAPTNISIGSYHQLYNDGYNKYILSLQIDKLWVERNSMDDIKKMV